MKSDFPFSAKFVSFFSCMIFLFFLLFVCFNFSLPNQRQRSEMTEDGDPFGNSDYFSCLGSWTLRWFKENVRLVVLGHDAQFLLIVGGIAYRSFNLEILINLFEKVLESSCLSIWATKSSSQRVQKHQLNALGRWFLMMLEMVSWVLPLKVAAIRKITHYYKHALHVTMNCQDQQQNVGVERDQMAQIVRRLLSEAGTKVFDLPFVSLKRKVKGDAFYVDKSGTKFLKQLQLSFGTSIDILKSLLKERISLDSFALRATTVGVLICGESLTSFKASRSLSLLGKDFLVSAPRATTNRFVS